MFTIHRSRIIHALIVLAALIWLASSVALRAQCRGSTTPLGLASFFAPNGAVFQDLNRDGVVDYVAAKIVLAPKPTAGEIAAAAEIAARLGFETMAMDLPVTAPDASGSPGAVVIVGSSHPAVARLAVGGVIDLKMLKAGQGLVAFVAAEQSGLEASALVVAGDERGVQAAAQALAGHAPALWDPSGPTYKSVEENLDTFLAQHGVPRTRVTLLGFVASDRTQGLDALALGVDVDRAADAIKARAALARLAAAHRAGREEKTLSYAGVAALHVRFVGGKATGRPVVVARAGAAPAEVPAPRARISPKEFKLSNIFSNEGLLGDSNNDHIPDRVDAVIVPGSTDARRVVDLAARFGLESTGIAVPIARTAGDIADPDKTANLILVGRDHPLVKKLIADKKIDPASLRPGEGLIEVVPHAFGRNRALVVTGADDAGVDRALGQMAERFPYVWQRGKDRVTLDEIENDARRFFAGRSPAGQAALGLYRAGKMLGALRGKDLESASVKIFTEKAPDGFSEFARRELAPRVKADKVEIAASNLDIHHSTPVFEDAYDIRSEVDEFWKVLRTKVEPALKKAKKDEPLTVEARLSEPPELRRALEQQAKEELVKAGAPVAATSVRILSAYKQGFSWLREHVEEAIKGKPIGSIVIRFAELAPPPQAKFEAMFSRIRWLQEIYPIDEVLAKDLGVPLSAFKFENVSDNKAAYEVEVRGPGGEPIYQGTFEPKVVLRPYFDQFPDYETVRVTTGWISARLGSQALADERIETDPETFWDWYQTKILPRVYTYVMSLTKGKPDPADAPFFSELNIDLTMSEPSYQLGVDQEQIASLEGVQEDLFFATLQFFDVLGLKTRGAGLQAPGRVIPVVHPTSDGKPGHAKVSFTGRPADHPKVVVEYRERGKDPITEEAEIPKIDIERPSVMAARVGDGREGIEALGIEVTADYDKDVRGDLVRTAPPKQVDRQVLYGEQALGVVEELGRLQQAKLFDDALAYDKLGQIEFTVHTPDGARTAVLHSSGMSKPPYDIRVATHLQADYKYSGRVVQWDEPIAPGEAYEDLARFSTFPEATVYHVGESFLGKDIWAMDLMPPVRASHWSQAKATVMKPTVIYSARQHANEVSSTSHTLRLAELLLTDPAYKKYLKRVNVVFHPITNPDGAQLAYDLQKITPSYMLHPGYLGSLGVDVTTYASQQDPLYPESAVRPRLWRTWLPDVFLNPHGYPSHEWVQPFSEYAAWVRFRITEARDWWGMRGWYTSLTYPLGEKYQRNRDFTMAIRNYIADSINSVPEVKAMNARAYARYGRYGYTFDPENYHLDLFKGVNIYMAPRGFRIEPGERGAGRAGGGQDFARDVDVTVYSGYTEAPDETAHGDWMKLVASAGLQYDLANLKLLYDSDYKVKRNTELAYDGVTMSFTRERGALPPKKETTSSPEK